MTLRLPALGAARPRALMLLRRADPFRAPAPAVVRAAQGVLALQIFYLIYLQVAARAEQFHFQVTPQPKCGAPWLMGVPIGFEYSGDFARFRGCSDTPPADELRVSADVYKTLRTAGGCGAREGFANDYATLQQSAGPFPSATEGFAYDQYGYYANPNAYATQGEVSTDLQPLRLDPAARKCHQPVNAPFSPFDPVAPPCAPVRKPFQNQSTQSALRVGGGSSVAEGYCGACG
jgi:hypothetical protein